MRDIQFSEERMEEVRRLISRYPEGRHKSALIPVLHLAQVDFEGWLSVEVMDYVAGLLGLAPIEVYEVASFYSMFNLKPRGQCLLEVCRTSSCWLNGAEDLVKHLEQSLGIKDGETTADGKFTLKTVECLGSCGTAPVMQVGATYHENVTFEKADEILKTWQEEVKMSNYCS